MRKKDVNVVSVKKVMIFIGTRPEAIKMAPVALNLQSSEKLDIHIVSSGQHGQMLSEAFQLFSLKPDSDLQVLTANQSLADLGSKLLSASARAIHKFEPDLVLVHGDTSTAFFSALASFYASVPVAHIEAGLRTVSVREPFPEELNRRAIGQIASMHFAPTDIARENLLKEKVAENSIFVTGNTVIDAVKLIYENFINNPAWFYKNQNQIRQELFPGYLDQPFALITLHRRENSGEIFSSYLTVLRKLSSEFPHFHFLFPVHPNPIIRSLASQMLGGIPNVSLVNPLNYLTFVQLLATSAFVITDSGGIQEEAFAFNKPVLLCREETERPEGISEGHTIIIGKDFALLESKGRELIEKAQNLNQPLQRITLNTSSNPFGDGLASARIRQLLDGS